MDVFKQICRLCLNPCENVERSIDDEPTRSQLNVVFQFKIDRDGSLPHVICEECSSKVEEFHTFHETVRANQDQLQVVVPQEEGDNVLVLVEVKGEPADGEAEIISKEEAHEKELKIESDDDNEAVNDCEEAQADEPESSENESCDKNDNDKADSKESSRRGDSKIESFFSTFQCGTCSEVFEKIDKLRKHSRKVHAKRWSITCCEKNFNMKYQLIDHIDFHLDPKQFYCEICKKQYKTRQNLAAHNQLRHNTAEDELFGCDQCSRKFAKKHMLKSHLITHVRAECSICNRVMANSQNLKLHMAKIHGGTRKPTLGHVCDICGKKFNTKHGFISHTNQHKGINTGRPQCPVCNKTMNSNSYLNFHMKNAHSDANLQVTCDICFQTVRHSRALESHKRKVHAEPTFGCEICGKMFKVAYHLKGHRATHTGEHRYSCSLCGMKSNNNIHSHIKNKHPEEYAQAKARGEVLYLTRDQKTENV